MKNFRRMSKKQLYAIWYKLGIEWKPQFKWQLIEGLEKRYKGV